MRCYIDPENQRYKYVVGRCINDYAVMVLVASTGERIPLTESVACQNMIRLPEGYRMAHNTEAPAEKELEAVAKLNGLVKCEQS